MKRSEAIEKAGVEAVERVESMNVDFTNRVTDGTHLQGYTEFSASAEFISEDGETAALIMYVYVESCVVDAVENLEGLDWDSAIADADFDII